MAGKPRLLVFDDGRGRFGPMTDLLSVMELRTGANTTLARIERSLGNRAAALHAQPRHRELLAERTNVPVNQPLEGEDWLIASGRWTAWRPAAIAAVGQLRPGQCVLDPAGEIVAARVGPGKAQDLIERGIKENLEVITLAQPALISRPWHIHNQLLDALAFDLENTDVPLVHRNSGQIAVVGTENVHVSNTAQVDPMVVAKSQRGPVVIDARAVVAAFSVLEGPCYVGPGSSVGPHARIRPGTAIGPSCHVTGEVNATVFQGFANKGHAGYLGHAWVGRFVNLGAETNVSNLKNTWGNIRVQLEAEGEAEDTRRHKLGPLLGDYVRTAIGTRLTTGAVVGTGSMLASSSFVGRWTDRLSFITDQGACAHEIDKLIEIARTMHRHKGLDLPASEEAALRALAAARGEQVGQR